ncbi:MAG: DsbC/DsbD-like thiol-disulfide interchange protein [Alphaproteobacteria bacterium]
MLNVEGEFLLNVISKLLLGLTSLGVVSMCFAATAVAAPYATDWIKGHNSRARLLVGGAPAPGGTLQRYVALELALEPGWKTYWRQPGSAGGIPPQLSWQGSSNLKTAILKFPAPIRMVDSSGVAIGYKKSIVFPIAIEANAPSRPIVVDLKVFFGVCREICIPAQAAFKVALNPNSFMQSPPQLIKALQRVPAVAGHTTKHSPVLKSVTRSNVGSGRRGLMFDVHFPGGTAGADLFAESGDLLPLAMTKMVAKPSPDTIRYKVVVDDDGQWRELGKTGLLLTIVSNAAASETRVPRP